MVKVITSRLRMMSKGGYINLLIIFLILFRFIILVSCSDSHVGRGKPGTEKPRNCLQAVHQFRTYTAFNVKQLHV